MRRVYKWVTFAGYAPAVLLGWSLGLLVIQFPSDFQHGFMLAVALVGGYLCVKNMVIRC